jgi:hypothetical protein
VQKRHQHLPVPTAAVDGLPARIFLKPAIFLIILKKSVLQFHENVSTSAQDKKREEKEIEEKGR